MNNLILNTLRGVKKRLIQYASIVFLVIIIISSITGLYSTQERAEKSFDLVAENSGIYNYRLDSSAINNYRSAEDSLTRIKTIILSQFPTDLPNYQTISDQVGELTVSDIQNSSLPQTSSTLDESLKTYLLNWGLNYNLILINDIFKNEVSTDDLTKDYQIQKSYFKSMDVQNNQKKWFLSFEDAYYLNQTPPLPTEGNSSFDFSPERNNIDKVYLTAGRTPQTINEVVLGGNFAEANNISLNSQIEFVQGQTLRVVGFGYTYWGISAKRTLDNLNPTEFNTTQIFTTREWLNKYLNDNITESSQSEQLFFLRVQNNDRLFSDRIQKIFNRTFNLDNDKFITQNTDDLRSGALEQTFLIQKLVYSAISIVVLTILIFIVLSYVRKEMDLQRKQIGILKALGYKNFQISIGFTILITLVVFASALTGLMLGIPLQLLFNHLSHFSLSLPLPIVNISLVAIVTSTVVTPIIFMIATYWQSMAKLNISPLKLIYLASSNAGSLWIARLKKPFVNLPFKPRLAIAFSLKSIDKLILIFLTFFLVSFLMLFQSIITDIFDNKVNNLYSFLNSDVVSAAASVDMHNYENTNLKDQSTTIYSWRKTSQLDPTKEIKATTIHITNNFVYTNFKAIQADIIANGIKNYYMTSKEMNILYANTKTEQEAYDYIHPDGSPMPEPEAHALATFLPMLFDQLIAKTGFDPNVQQLPGISVGQNIYDNNIYPNLEFSVTTPVSWAGHNQGPLIAKNIISSTLYNDNNNGSWQWKNWFNFQEEKGRQIDDVFDTSHNIITQSVTYVNPFGDTETKNAYIVPAVISKALAILNDYKVNDQVLFLVKAKNDFIPVIFSIKGVINNNLDYSYIYSNIDDIRKALEFAPTQNDPIFNYYYSKSSDILPMNSVNLAQLDNDYSVANLQKSYVVINKTPLIFSLLKSVFINLFGGINQIISITKFLTIAALAFVLIIIINMILDNNIMIIAMMRSFGYRINEINLLIIGSYIFVLSIAFVAGTAVAYVTWNVILYFVNTMTSTIFNVPILPGTIGLSFGLIALVMLIGYSVGLYFIKFKPASKLLQSD